MTDKTHRAFTLVELLIVIAIIALLVALLFPALSKLDIIKKETACQRNLREIQRVFAAYAAMNDGRYPYPVDHYYGAKFIGTWTPKNVWAGLPHVSQMIQAGSKAEMWYCPFRSNYGDWDSWPMNTWEKPYHPHWRPEHVYVYVGYTLFIYRQTRFADTRPTPTRNSVADDIPLAADRLSIRKGGSMVGGWTHGGGNPDGLWNSDCFTVFKSGAVKFTSKNAFDWEKPALTIGSCVDYWWFALNLKD
jgi:prepilin-type N-terminal cleavage/methylation domain-containing protein